MKHYVGYHNTEKMGRPFGVGDPFRILTNRPVDRLQAAIIWVIVGEGSKPRRYSLGSVFRVTKTGEAAEEGFAYSAAGNGHRCEPPVPLTDLPWFGRFKETMNRFQFGVQPIPDSDAVAELEKLVAAKDVSWLSANR